MAAAAGALRCERGHSFDVARQGYTSLVDGKRGAEGDDAAMVAARDTFLTAGWYRPITDAVAQATETVAAAGAVVDVGSGTGWYLSAALDANPARMGLALDASKFAARRAARCHTRAGAVVCDAWRGLPVRDGSAAVVLDVFAPRNGAEMARVLAPGGALLVVIPTSRHLAELARPLGLLAVDPRKEERLDAELSPHFGCDAREEVSFTLSLDRSATAALVAMGPSARHREPGSTRARIAALPAPIEVSVSVLVSRWSV